MKIGIIIPVHNEAKQIGKVIEKIKKRGLDAVVIDDGSTDLSGAIAENNGAVVIRSDRKNGKGFSLQRGFDYILRHDYIGVITMDGDGQHDADDLPVFLETIQKHPACIVNGSRMQDIKKMPFMRLLTNRFLSWLISSVCKQPIPDSQCGFRYIPSDVLKRITLTSKSFEIETEVLIKASRLGRSILSVPIRTIYNDEESKINPIKDTIRFFAYLIHELRSSK